MMPIVPVHLQDSSIVLNSLHTRVDGGGAAVAASAKAKRRRQAAKIG